MERWARKHAEQDFGTRIHKTRIENKLNMATLALFVLFKSLFLKDDETKLHRKNHLLKYDHTFFAVVYKNVFYIKFVKIIGHLIVVTLAIINLFRKSFQNNN